MSLKTDSIGVFGVSHVGADKVQCDFCWVRNICVYWQNAEFDLMYFIISGGLFLIQA